MFAKTCAISALLATLAVADLASDCSAGTFHIGQSVKTSSGTIIGHAASNATQVSEYLAIPYAQPPVGSRRFQPPVAYTSNQVFNNSHFGHDCPQVPGAGPPPGLGVEFTNFILTGLLVGDQFSEDCLHLNVWTKPQVGAAKKPVMVWVHGGAFDTGGTNATVYNGQYWADTADVVFVNLNYRLNIFGFSGAPNVTQNVGLLDQRLALEWVRNNIAAFGGDPNRITLFGQSAGSASVDYYSFAWTADPIIQGSILESGTVVGIPAQNSSIAASAWYTVAETVGCGNAASGAAAVLHCMQNANISFAQLETASHAATNPALKSAFGPVIDGKTVFANYTKLLNAGKFIQKPSIVGSNNDEQALFDLATGSTANDLPATQKTFTCPAGKTAALRAKLTPTWRYYYTAMYPNQLIPTVNLTEAYHTAEIGILFGNTQDATKTDDTWQERLFSSYMRGAWSAFAHDPVNGLSSLYGWPTYNSVSQSVVLLGSNNFLPPAQYISPATIDTGC